MEFQKGKKKDDRKSILILANHYHAVSYGCFTHDIFGFQKLSCCGEVLLGESMIFSPVENTYIKGC